MGRKQYTIEVPEIIEEIIRLTGKDWNDACNDVDFCKYESSSENWDIDSVNDMLENDPERLDFKALKSLMLKAKQKEVLIIND